MIKNIVNGNVFQKISLWNQNVIENTWLTIPVLMHLKKFG